jgi:hypothetical protein
MNQSWWDGLKREVVGFNRSWNQKADRDYRELTRIRMALERMAPRTQQSDNQEKAMLLPTVIDFLDGKVDEGSLRAVAEEMSR